METYIAKHSCCYPLFSASFPFPRQSLPASTWRRRYSTQHETVLDLFTPFAQSCPCLLSSSVAHLFTSQTFRLSHASLLLHTSLTCASPWPVLRTSESHSSTRSHFLSRCPSCITKLFFSKVTTVLKTYLAEPHPRISFLCVSKGVLDAFMKLVTDAEEVLHLQQKI